MRARSQMRARVLAAGLLLLVSAGSAVAGPNTLNRDSIPEEYKWDLTDIYPDWEAWQAGLTQLEALMDEYTTLQGTLGGGADRILKAYQLGDELGILLWKVYAYPALTRSLDTRNNEVGANMQKVQILMARFNTATAWFDPELLQIPWDTMKTWLDETAELAPYRFGIEDLYRQQEHVLDEGKERLLSYFTSFNNTPETAYDDLTTSDIKYGETVLSDGDSLTVTPGQYYNILSTNRSQDDRRTAFETFYGVYHANRNTYAAIYNGILQRDWALAQARNYGSCLESYLDGDNVPTDIFESLVTATKNGVTPYHRYNALRKQALGLETYHGYDGSIPIVDFEKSYDYEEIKEWIVEAVKPLGKEYQERMKEAFDNRWIDVYENEGKSTGAFSAGIYGVHPFLLLNYNETLENVFTVAHELGHCMHSILSHENQPYSTSSPTIFVAEVASTMNEALLLEYMFERTKDPIERIALLQRAIDNIIGTFYTQVMFAQFGWEAHRMAEEGHPITADGLSNLYTKLWKENQGEAVQFDSLYGSTWARISHFFGTPFYVYKYATSFATSAQLARGITSEDKKTRQETLDLYMTLLKSGANDYPMEQLRKAGVDLADPATFQAVIDNFDNLVTRMETELAKL